MVLSFLNSRGVCANFADFFGITCCGATPEEVDWRKTYDVPKDTTEEPKLPEPTIPLPHYSTIKTNNITGEESGYNPDSDSTSDNTTHEPHLSGKVHTI